MAGTTGLERIQPVTLQETVYRELKRALMEGRFLPGECLKIRTVANALGTSTMPVREALQRLVAERALEFLPNRSACVPEMTREQFTDLTRVRLEVEGLAAELAADRVSPSQIDELSRAIRQMEMAAEAGDGDDFSRGNQRFHFGVYDASGSEHLVPFIESLWLRVGPFLASTLRDENETSPLGEELVYQHQHLLVLDALRRGDGAAARAGIREDLQQAAQLYHEFHLFPGDGIKSAVHADTQTTSDAAAM